jgi:RimJ/RimL family protein N-acetyltransferase
VERARPADAERLVAALAPELPGLRPWLRWATPEGISLETQRSRLEAKDSCWRRRSEYVYSIVDGPAIIGSIGLGARSGPWSLEIGYWLAAAYRGRGVVTAAARALTEAGLALEGIARIQIHCDEANTASAAVPRRLGYRLDRVEKVEPLAPGEIGRRMIWVFPADVEDRRGLAG